MLRTQFSDQTESREKKLSIQCPESSEWRYECPRNLLKALFGLLLEKKDLEFSRILPPIMNMAIADQDSLKKEMFFFLLR